jgi:hypothetical protein
MKDGPEMGQKAHGPAGPGRLARPIFVAVRAPLWTRVASGVLIVSLQKFGSIHPQKLGET